MDKRRTLEDHKTSPEIVSGSIDGSDFDNFGERMYSIENCVLQLIEDYHMEEAMLPEDKDLLKRTLPQYLNAYLREQSGFEFIREEIMKLPVSSKIRHILVRISELIREVSNSTKAASTLMIKTPEEVYQHFFHLKFLRHEIVKILYLNGQNELIKSKDVARGDINSVKLKPELIFGPALMLQSHRLIIVHNHPTGRVLPSEDDLRFTRKVQNCAEILSVQLIDHIIIGDGFYSFRYNDLL